MQHYGKVRESLKHTIKVKKILATLYKMYVKQTTGPSRTLTILPRAEHATSVIGTKCCHLAQITSC